MILNEEGKKEFLKSNFHQYFDITLQSDITENNVVQFVNYVLPLEKLDYYYSIEEMKPFFNDEYNNVIFTSADNNYIYQYEIYQDVYFIRMNPFSSEIRMHILPKKYNASNSSLLIFKDNKQNIDDSNFECTTEYQRLSDKNNINLYYKQGQRVSSNGFYKFYIKDKTQYFSNLQINMGYSYNDTNPNPRQIKHYTGILDQSDENGNLITDNQFTEYNAALMDANYDNVASFTNVSKQQEFRNNQIQWPTNTNPYDDGEETHTVGFMNAHSNNTLYHKTIKYFNDDIYIEEDNPENKFIIQSWVEQ